MPDETNAPPDHTPRGDSWRLLRVAATTPEILSQEVNRVRHQLLRGELPATDVIGAGPIRIAFPTSSIDHALKAIDNAVAIHPQKAQPTVAFLFPGLEGESIDRLGALLPLDEGSARVLAEADAVTNELLGLTVSQMLQTRRTIGKRPALVVPRLRPDAIQASEPVPTVQAHALLFTLECALAQLWLGWGVKPAYVCGYSMGEYAAAYIAGIFDFSDGLRLLIERARRLESLPHSAMLAIAAPANYIRRDGVYNVAENTPDQTILGGDKQAIDALDIEFRAAGVITQRVAVEYAFHTPLLAPAQQALTEFARRVPTRAPAIPIVSTVTGKFLSDRQAPEPQHWANHLCQPVQFRQALETLKGAAVDICLEIGPGQALSLLVEAAFKQNASPRAISSMPSDFDRRPAGVHLLDAAGKLWAAGSPIETLPRLSIDTRPNNFDSSVKEGMNDPAVTSEIQRIWARALGHSAINSDDNLFDLGATSLIATKITLQLRRTFNIELNIRDLFASPTPRRLARVISEGTRAVATPSDLLVLPNGMPIRYQSRAEAMYFYKSIFEDLCYLRHGISISKGAIILDIGANIGMFSMFAALAEPTATIYSFEPVPPLFDILRFNLFDVSDSAVPHNFGLGSASGEAIITYYPENPGMSSFRACLTDEQEVLIALLRNSRDAGNASAAEILENTDEFLGLRLKAETFSAPLKTISQFIAEQNLPRIDLLKVDVQKFEMEVLNGIDHGYWDRIRQLVVEVHDIDGRVHTAREMLTTRGYDVVIEQDPLYRDTDIFNLYARRPS